MAEVMEILVWKQWWRFLPSSSDGNCGTGNSGGGLGLACSDGGLGPLAASDSASV